MIAGLFFKGKPSRCVAIENWCKRIMQIRRIVTL